MGSGNSDVHVRRRVASSRRRVRAPSNHLPQHRRRSGSRRDRLGTAHRGHGAAGGPGGVLCDPRGKHGGQEGRNNENRTHGCCCSLLAQGACLWKSVSRIEGNSASVVPGGGYCARNCHRSGDGPARRRRLCRRWCGIQLVHRKLARGTGLRPKIPNIPQGYRLHARLVGQYTVLVNGNRGRQQMGSAKQVRRIWRHESKYRLSY